MSATEQRWMLDGTAAVPNGNLLNLWVDLPKPAQLVHYWYLNKVDDGARLLQSVEDGAR